jgi:hypothetical protein
MSWRHVEIIGLVLLLLLAVHVGFRIVWQAM